MFKVNLAGRIDANNAAENESRITSELAASPESVPVFDAENLEYISSAGLRMLLKFRKKFDRNIDVINVSGEVYDILEVTGFTELLNVRKKLRNISLEGCPVIGEGALSKVYRLDHETIVKVFTHPTANLERAEADRKTSREVFLHDIPTAIPYDVVKVGERYGLVYEMIDADTVSAAVRKHPERLEELALKMSRLMKKLHTTEFKPGTFPDVRDILHSMIHRPYSMGLINADDKALVDELIDSLPSRNTFVHFDYHPKNVMLSNDELVLIDVGDSGLGDPIVDLLASYSHFVTIPKFTAEQGLKNHEQSIGLDAKTLGAMWDVIMPDYFGTTDKSALAGYEEVINGWSLITRIYGITVAHIPDSLRDRAAVSFMESLRKVLPDLKPIEGI